MGPSELIVLAYSGGLDTSVLLKQYIEAGHEVIAMTADLGESDMVAGVGAQAALEGVRKKALDLGAEDAVLIDARERFIDRLRAAGAARQRAVSGRLSALGRALAAADRRPAGRRRRRRTGADAVAHGCTGKGNDQVRIEVGVRARDPRLAAWRRCATSRSRGPTRSPTRRRTASESRTPSTSRTRSTPTCGAARSKPACSKTRGTRRPRTRTRGPRGPPNSRPNPPTS